MANTQAKLSQVETETLEKITDLSIRKQVETQILASKQEALDRAQKARSEFRMKSHKKGMLSVYGVGYRFPVTLPAEGWEIVFSNVEAIRAELLKNKK